MRTCNINFLCASVTVKCAYSFRYQKCAGIHWFKYYYLHKSTPCSEDFGRFDGASYTDWGVCSRLFSSRGAVWFLQVCTRNKTRLKRYLLLILCNILIFCTGKKIVNDEHSERKMYKTVIWYWHFGKSKKS